MGASLSRNRGDSKFGNPGMYFQKMNVVFGLVFYEILLFRSFLALSSFPLFAQES